MYTQRNVGYLQIGGTVTGFSARATAINDLLVGEVGVFTPEGVLMTEALAATEDRFVVATKQADGVVVKSPVYRKADIASAKRLVYAAETAQVDYIGYNGTSGSIEAINNNLYKIDIQVQELLRSNTDGRKVKFGFYQSDSSATQAEIAIGLAGSLIYNFDREPEKFITFKAICNDALAAGEDFDETISVVNGSKVIANADATPTYNTGTALAVGDFIRFGATTTSAVALTDDVYEVKSISGANITLDRPVQLASGDYVTGSNYTQVIPAADGASADWGIVMTGASLSFTAGKFNAEVARWESQLKDFGTTSVDLMSTAASPGSGTVNQVAQMEWFYQGNEGEYHREGFSTLFSPRANTNPSVAGSGYDLFALTFNSTDNISFQKNVSPQVLYIAAPADSTGANYLLTATADDVTDVLEVLAFGSANGNLAVS